MDSTCKWTQLVWGSRMGVRMLVIVGVALMLCAPPLVRGHEEQPEGEDLCGQKCSCRATVVRCFELVHMPKIFPQNTTKIYFEQLVTELVPADAFKSIPMVKTIEFSRSNIGRIAGCAFDGLTDLEDLYFSRTVIGSIATMAISNIDTPTSVVMQLSTITTLETAAFSNLRNISMFQISNCTIHEMEPNVFSGISNVEKGFVITKTRLIDSNGPFLHDMQSVGKIAFTENRIGAFPCLALDSLASSDNLLAISNNYFNCTCVNLGKGDHLTEHEYVKAQLMNSVCFGVTNGQEITLTEYLEKSSCKPKTCSSFQARDISRLSCKPERVRRKNTNTNGNVWNAGNTSLMTSQTWALLIVVYCLLVLT
ncbi:leucine-rich repeat-containing protein 4-like [Pecten maximus]|uniref:leucine-rich repeat-containing protein 4-like n=1 Tax=Pecten maximus TaxID=6579 RepID=UPI0014586BD4|nr:leucine-rich repeat-containing protein 4-like [Pecten maximus]